MLFQRFGIVTAFWTPVLFGLGLVCLFGCPVGGGSSINDILGGQIGDVLEQIDENRLTLRIVNQTDANLEVDFLVDGQPRTISCSALEVVCDSPVLPCPGVIEIVSERRLDGSGGFVGGRTFNGNEQFIFRQGVDVNCGQFIIYRFSVDQVEAFAL